MAHEARDYLGLVYAVYAVVSVALTVWLARTLFKNGAVFLRDVFKENPDLAEAVNRLLVVGFYLLNLGYACLLLRAEPAPTTTAAIETLASKLGALLLSLGAMHFVNMYLFHRIRRRALIAQLPPPVPSHYRLDYTPRAAYEAGQAAVASHVMAGGGLPASGK